MDKLNASSSSFLVSRKGLAPSIHMLWTQNFFIYGERRIFVVHELFLKNQRGNYDSGHSERADPSP